MNKALAPQPSEQPTLQSKAAHVSTIVMIYLGITGIS